MSSNGPASHSVGETVWASVGPLIHEAAAASREEPTLIPRLQGLKLLNDVPPRAIPAIYDLSKTAVLNAVGAGDAHAEHVKGDFIASANDLACPFVVPPPPSSKGSEQADKACTHEEVSDESFHSALKRLVVSVDELVNSSKKTQVEVTEMLKSADADRRKADADRKLFMEAAHESTRASKVNEAAIMAMLEELKQMKQRQCVG